MNDYSLTTLTLTADHRIASKACGSLEDAGIPVMLERLEISGDGGNSIGYRLKVPHARMNYALKILDGANRGYLPIVSSRSSFIRSAQYKQ